MRAATVAAAASRALAAIVGGYALASAWIVLLPACLPLARAEAVLLASLSGFAVHAGVAVWCYAVADLWRVWRGLVLATASLAVAGLLLARWTA